MSYFATKDFTKHNDSVYEAKDFLNQEQCLELISYANSYNTQCLIHGHEEHGEKDGNTFTWSPECFGPEVLGQKSETLSLSSFNGLSLLIHSMNDLANRFTNNDMKLTKVILHRYIPGAVSPVHADVFPLATLLYLNDDYQGGELHFPESGLELKPPKGSVLVFDGGESNMHGVKSVRGTVRYVLVAFWDYVSEADQINFYNVENGYTSKESKDEINISVLFPDKFPVLKVSNFISKELADKLMKYLDINHIEGDQCYGPICFREYWDKQYGLEQSPILIDGITEDTIPSINKQIEKVVHTFMSNDDLVFSKIKGHGHVTNASSPPHTHPPAEAVAILILNENFEGGQTFIPQYGIELESEACALYVFSEQQELAHGVRQITKGMRYSIMSHWQPSDHPYRNAGANI